MKTRDAKHLTAAAMELAARLCRLRLEPFVPSSNTLVLEHALPSFAHVRLAELENALDRCLVLAVGFIMLAFDSRPRPSLVACAIGCSCPKLNPVQIEQLIEEHVDNVED
eukprot:7358748-Prymnesium_polylepis.1